MLMLCFLVARGFFFIFFGMKAQMRRGQSPLSTLVLYNLWLLYEFTTGNSASVADCFSQNKGVGFFETN